MFICNHCPYVKAILPTLNSGFIELKNMALTQLQFLAMMLKLS